MKLHSRPWALAAYLLHTISKAGGSALTTVIGANERSCFYVDVDKAGEKIGVCAFPFLALTLDNYFNISVLFCGMLLKLLYRRVSITIVKVQSGGSFDINFDVKNPEDKIILDGKEERQGDYVLTANKVGEYGFCFENDMSTLTGKLIDIDITVESEPRRDVSAKPGQIADQTSALEESIYRLGRMLSNIRRDQRA